MKLSKIQTKFNCSADDLWNLFSDVTRSDWVPFAKDILLEDNIRTFVMDGVGEIKEQIIDLNNEKKTLSYSVIKSPAPLNHHLAKISVLAEAENRVTLIWTSEVEPDHFEQLIKDGMESSITLIKKILE